MSPRLWHKAFRVQPSSDSEQSRHLGFPGDIRQGFLAKADQSKSLISFLRSGVASFTQVTFECFFFSFKERMGNNLFPSSTHLCRRECHMNTHEYFTTEIYIKSFLISQLLNVRAFGSHFICQGLSEVFYRVHHQFHVLYSGCNGAAFS